MNKRKSAPVFGDTRQVPGAEGCLPILESDEVAQRETYAGADTLNPDVLHLGVARYTRAQTALPAHVHRTCFEICYIFHGALDWEVGGRPFSVQTGDFFVTRPGEVHGGAHSIMGPCELFFIQIRFHSSRCRAFTLQDCRPLLEGLSNRRFPAGPRAADLCRRLIEECGRPDKCSPMAVRSLVAGLVVEVARSDRRNRSRVEPAPGSHAIRRAQAYLRDRVDSMPSMKDVARAAGLSRSALHERFRLETGTTPREYVLAERLRRARHLLHETDARITDIALRVGFCSSQHFATVFRRHVGLSPAAYRQDRSPSNRRVTKAKDHGERVG